MKQYIKRPWTHEERNLLRKEYDRSSGEELLQLFPGRTKNAITKQVYYLRKRGWTFKEKK